VWEISLAEEEDAGQWSRVESEWSEFAFPKGLPYSII